VVAFFAWVWPASHSGNGVRGARWLGVAKEIDGWTKGHEAVADKPPAPIGKLLGSTQQLHDNMVRMVYRSLKNTPANPA
jgi:hypothetical protein